jgi:hypothetical protein
MEFRPVIHAQPRGLPRTDRFAVDGLPAIEEAIVRSALIEERWLNAELPHRSRSA